MAPSLATEVDRRRTFAIISHPDAGKTTITEKFLLYGGAIFDAGSVKAKGRGRAATSDWMEIERKRGISITSSALQFEYKGHCVNLLDTPGHQDFSEDTYRTLVAADCALMLIDGAKGVEPQTVKLFHVCRERGLPVVTVVNKMDRPARSPLDLVDEVEKVLGITVVPLTWPVHTDSQFRGVFDIDRNQAHLFETSEHNKHRAGLQVTGPEDPELTREIGEAAHAKLTEDLEMLSTCVEPFDQGSFLAGQVSPMFFASALTNFGVENILERFLDLCPPPGPLPTVDGEVPPDAEFFSGFVYKIAANMDKQHRDRVAFMRVTSGRFERGMSARHIRLGRDIRLSNPFRFFGQDRTTIDEAYPGDVIGLINPGLFRVGDVLSSGPRLEVRNFPRFAPEIFAQVRPRDPSMGKGFRKGVQQLSEEGVVQVFYPRTGMRNPILGAIGELQIEVFKHRLEHEYNVVIQVERLGFERARWLRSITDEVAGYLPAVVVDESNRLVALFRSEHQIGFVNDRYKDLELLEHPPSEEDKA